MRWGVFIHFLVSVTKHLTKTQLQETKAHFSSRFEAEQLIRKKKAWWQGKPLATRVSSQEAGDAC